MHTAAKQLDIFLTDVSNWKLKNVRLSAARFSDPLREGFFFGVKGEGSRTSKDVVDRYQNQKDR